MGVNREYLRLLVTITVVTAVGMRFYLAVLSGLLSGPSSPFGLLTATSPFDPVETYTWVDFPGVYSWIGTSFFVAIATVVSYYRFGLVICFLVNFSLGVSYFVTFHRPSGFAGDMGGLFLSETMFVAFASCVTAFVGFSIGRSVTYWRNTHS